MTNDERRDRGHRAAHAFNEFVAPVIEELRAEYLGALSQLAIDHPWESGKITKLAVAQRVINTVEAHIKALIVDGTEADHKLSRAEQIASLPEAKRRWIG